MKYQRKCPSCKNMIEYSDKSILYRKKSIGQICRNCWKIKRASEKNKCIRNCPKCKKKIQYSDYRTYWNACKHNCICKSCSKIGNPSRSGQRCSKQHKLKLSIIHKGRIISNTSKYKMRLAAIKRMKDKGILTYRNFNKNACRFFDELNKERGWELQHALNGGEVEVYGYFLDAYDKNKNLVVEYDEPSHDRPCIKKKDKIRQNNIINYLKCKFYRYKEAENKLIKVV